MYFDTHAHYDDARFDPDRDELINALHRDGVDYILNPGADAESSRKAVGLGERFPFVYAAAGIHPEDAESAGNGALSVIEGLLGHEKVRAVGEIGLDYHYPEPDRETQLRCFRAQMALAQKHRLPVIVHDREAHGDCMSVVREFPEVRGVFHCYSGSAEQASELVSLGWSLSFTGSLTFKNARRLPEVASMLPDASIMIETDAPYLAPEPFRGRRNHSGYLQYICRRLAELRGLSLEEAAALTKENGLRFFGIK